MTTVEAGITDAAFIRRGTFIAAPARGLCLALSLTAALFLGSSPQTRPRPALAAGLAYCMLWGASWAWTLRHPRGRRTRRVVHDVLNARAMHLAREMARLHGGRIDVHRRPRRGRVFSVRLPRGPRPQTAHA
jgi:hypothetical protein